MIKFTVLYGHPDDPQAFEQHYAAVHLPLARELPGMTRLELTRFAPGPVGARPAYYRMAELYFESEPELVATFGSATGQATVADLANFATGGVTTLLGTTEG